MPAEALKMAVELRRLRHKWGVELSQPHILPLAPPISGPTLLEGWATTANEIDLDNVKLMPHAFGTLPKSVPLLFHHKDDKVAGEIKSLEYREGSVWVTCQVNDPEIARHNGFSIAAVINKYHIVDGPNFHAVVTDATLMDISITDRPCNTSAQVKKRYAPCHAAVSYDLIQRKVELLQQLLRAKMKEQTHEHPNP